MSTESVLFAFDLSLLVLIWLVQVIIYPTFMHVEPTRFIKYHRRYTGQITWFVVPLMFGQVGFHVHALMQSPSAIQIAGGLLILLAWLATFGLSVPCHSKLASRGYDVTTISWLIRTNWIRTLAWTGVVIMDILPV